MGALEEDHQVLIYTLYQPTDRSYLTLPAINVPSPTCTALSSSSISTQQR
jgi:hypothetical protein